MRGPRTAVHCVRKANESSPAKPAMPATRRNWPRRCAPSPASGSCPCSNAWISTILTSRFSSVRWTTGSSTARPTPTSPTSSPRSGATPRTGCTPSTIGRTFNVNPRWNPNVALWSPQLEANTDGSVDVVISAQPHDGNWISIDPGFRGDESVPDSFPMADGGLVLRSYYLDWYDERPPGLFHIDRVDDSAPIILPRSRPHDFPVQLAVRPTCCARRHGGGYNDP